MQEHKTYQRFESYEYLEEILNFIIIFLMDPLFHFFKTKTNKICAYRQKTKRILGERKIFHLQIKRNV